MSKALEYIEEKYNIDSLGKDLPIMIPNIGRDVIPGWLHHLNFKKGVELGVASGVFSEQIIRANPQMHLIGIDPYLPYTDYRDYAKQSTFTKMENDALGRLSNIHNYEFMKKLSMDALNEFEDESLDFLYIDANHEDPFITQDIEAWPAKVRSGGIVCGHDYMRTREGNFKVKEAIRKYTKDNNINPWFVLGAEGKIKGTTRDSSRSWMFIKE